MLVPDAARGFALLGIAIANITTAWLVTEPSESAAFFGGIHEGAGALAVADRVSVVIGAIAVHNRGLPMFSTLLGFGIGLIALSLYRRRFPISRARVIIARRYAFLALFGALHTVFLFYGDIMTLYGICGILFALVIGFRNRTLSIIAWVALGVSTIMGIISFIAFFGLFDDLTGDAVFYESNTDLATLPETLRANLEALGLTIVSSPLAILMYFPLMMIGFVWAREGVLADVAANRKLLIRWAVVAAAIAIGVGLPWGLSAIDVLPNEYELAFETLNGTLGIFTGPGILAAFALALAPLQRKIWAGAPMPSWLVAVVALGKRSMSGYLLQSIVFFVLVYPFMLHIPRDLGAATDMAIAFGVWLFTLLFAWALEMRGAQGPFEKVHRRLSYGPTMRPELKA